MLSPLEYYLKTSSRRDLQRLCKPSRRAVTASDLKDPSIKWMAPAAAKFRLSKVDRRSPAAPFDSRSAYEFDLGKSVVGLNFLNPNFGTISPLPLFLHIAFLFRKERKAKSFERLADLLELLEQGEDSLPLVFYGKVGGSFLNYLGVNESFDSEIAPSALIKNQLQNIGFEETPKKYGLKGGKVFIREFNSSNPCEFSQNLDLETAVNDFSRLEREFQSFLSSKREN